MLEKVTCTYYFLGIRKVIEKVLSLYNDCTRNKPSRHLPYRKLKLLRTLTRVWKSIALDFIVKLPPLIKPFTSVEYNLILVVTDRLTKYAYFIPYKESSLANKLAYVFFRHI